MKMKIFKALNIDFKEEEETDDKTKNSNSNNLLI